MVQVGKVYKHYKGNNYLVLAVACHSETDEPMVVYVTLYDNPKSKIWARPLSMWEEEVKDSAGKLVPRFVLVGDSLGEL